MGPACGPGSGSILAKSCQDHGKIILRMYYWCCVHYAHPTRIFLSMLVLGMMQPILPLPLKERIVYTAAHAQDRNDMEEPIRHITLKTLIHHQMISTMCIKPNKANHHLHHYLGFRGITPESQPPLHL